MSSQSTDRNASASSPERACGRRPSHRRAIPSSSTRGAARARAGRAGGAVAGGGLVDVRV